MYSDGNQTHRSEMVHQDSHSVTSRGKEVLDDKKKYQSALNEKELPALKEEYQIYSKQLSNPILGNFYFRLLISTREAAGVIGKQGVNVENIRHAFGVRITVNKANQGVQERICSIVGPDFKESVKACARVAELCRPDIAPLKHDVAENAWATMSRQLIIRYLVPNACIGRVIGQGGSTVKELMERSGARIVVSKQVLPQSTERVVEICGSIEEIIHGLDSTSRIVYDDIQGRHSVVYYDTKNSTTLQQGHTVFSYSSSLTRPSLKSTMSPGRQKGKRPKNRLKDGVVKSEESTKVDSHSQSSHTSFERKLEIDAKAVNSLNEKQEIRKDTGTIIRI